MQNIGFLRQWLNERPDMTKLVTNEDILHWLPDIIKALETAEELAKEFEKLGWDGNCMCGQSDCPNGQDYYEWRSQRNSALKKYRDAIK